MQADEVEKVTKKAALDFEVQLRISREGGTQVHLQEPGLKLLVD